MYSHSAVLYLRIINFRFMGDIKGANVSGDPGFTLTIDEFEDEVDELIVIDDELRKMIHEKRSEQDLTQYARHFSFSIYQDGLTRVLQGDSSLEEVLRVVGDE